MDTTSATDRWVTGWAWVSALGGRIPVPHTDGPDQKPMHGYALIQAIGMTYQRPVSPGWCIQHCRNIEDMGVRGIEGRDGKKVYSITKGKKYLGRNEEVVDRLKAGQEYAGKIGQFNFIKDIRDIQAMLMVNAEYINKEKMERIQEASRRRRGKWLALCSASSVGSRGKGVGVGEIGRDSRAKSSCETLQRFQVQRSGILVNVDANAAGS